MEYIYYKKVKAKPIAKCGPWQGGKTPATHASIIPTLNNRFFVNVWDLRRGSNWYESSDSLEYGFITFNSIDEAVRWISDNYGGIWVKEF